MVFKRLSKVLVFILVVFSFCSINVVNASETEYYLGGNVLGFTVNTEGVNVVGVCDVVTPNGLFSPCKNAGIDVGDTILSLNQNAVNTANDVALALNNYQGGEIITKIESDGKIKLVDLEPVKDVLGEYKLGVYLQDGLTGLGTVTYYTNNGSFGSLGHPVSNENGKIYNVLGGNVFNASVTGVNKPERGKAGELKGVILGDGPVGDISKNSSVGLFGKLSNFDKSKHVKLALGKGVPGKAQIYSTVDGIAPKFYDINIVKTDYVSGSNKNFVISITDKNLLSYTGGILQGMSGSPIVQNGKLVGAVTHVFLNDGTRGYGISINNMIA